VLDFESAPTENNMAAFCLLLGIT